METWIRKWLRDCYVKQNLREVDLHEAPRVLDSNDGGRKYPDTSGFTPLSSTSTWLSVEGAIQRLLFAFTMGIIALGGLILLWTVSVPWIAWHILLWAIRKVRALGHTVVAQRGSAEVFLSRGFLFPNLRTCGRYGKNWCV